MITEKKHNKKRRSYSLFLIPRDHSRIHKIQVTPRLVGLLAGSLVVSFLFLIFNAAGFWYYKSLSLSLMEQKEAFDEYQGERDGLVQKVQLLEETVNQTEKYTAQLAALVGTSTPPLKKGIGPIPVGEFSVQGNTASLDGAVMDPKLDGLQKRAKELQSKIKDLYKTQKEHLSFVSATPSLWPVKGWVTSDFGYRRSPFGYRPDFHNGMDIASQVGTAVVASADGIVTYANYKGGLGKAVIIDHGFGVKTVYGHNSGLLVREGQRVTKGTPIALVGSTGHSTGPHCHFEVRIDGVAVDPMPFLMGNETTVASARLKAHHRQ